MSYNFGCACRELGDFRRATHLLDRAHLQLLKYCTGDHYTVLTLQLRVEHAQAGLQMESAPGEAAKKLEGLLDRMGRICRSGHRAMAARCALSLAEARRRHVAETEATSKMAIMAVNTAYGNAIPERRDLDALPAQFDGPLATALHGQGVFLVKYIGGEDCETTAMECFRDALLRANKAEDYLTAARILRSQALVLSEFEQVDKAIENFVTAHATLKENLGDNPRHTMIHPEPVYDDLSS